MRKLILVTIMATLIALCGSANLLAAPPSGETASVTATASIGGVATLNIAPANIEFGTTNVDAFPTDPVDKKIVLTYTSNYDPWKTAVYTNNTQVPSSTRKRPT